MTFEEEKEKIISALLVVKELHDYLMTETPPLEIRKAVEAMLQSRLSDAVLSLGSLQPDKPLEDKTAIYLSAEQVTMLKGFLSTHRTFHPFFNNEKAQVFQDELIARLWSIEQGTWMG